MRFTTLISCGLLATCALAVEEEVFKGWIQQFVEGPENQQAVEAAAADIIDQVPDVVLQMLMQPTQDLTTTYISIADSSAEEIDLQAAVSNADH